MMQTIVDLVGVLGLLFFIGIPVAVCVSVISAFAVDGAKKRAIKTAEEAGVELTLKPVPGPPTWTIEGIVYCIGFIVFGIILLILAILGISLPSEVPEDIQMMIAAIVSGVFAVFFWALILWSPFYVKAERRKLQRALEEALSKKSM